MWNTAGLFWYNFALMLQSPCVDALYFLVICQWYLTLTSPSTQSLSQIQHLVEFSKIFLPITSSLLKCFFSTVFTFFNHTINKIINSIFIQVWLKRLTKFVINTYFFYKHNCKQHVFDIGSYKTHQDFAFH